ncbi:MAG: hypothetical protein IT361_03535 [Gemmatimonadaceae bacterium]|nr:hypothetical protein [Gemmatimonadaceae bacterium]
MSDPIWTHAEANGAEGGPNDTGNVDKIRDILFGSQMRDYDRRFAATEERLGRESTNLREDLGRRMLATEQYLRAELEALSSSLRSEERERLQGVRDAMDAIGALNRELSDRVAALAEQSAQAQRDLRAQLQDTHRALAEETARRHDEISDALRREAFDLRSAKADRSTIAAMFAEFAQRLAGGPDAR